MLRYTKALSLALLFSVPVLGGMEKKGKGKVEPVNPEAAQIIATLQYNYVPKREAVAIYDAGKQKYVLQPESIVTHSGSKNDFYTHKDSFKVVELTEPVLKALATVPLDELKAAVAERQIWNATEAPTKDNKYAKTVVAAQPREEYVVVDPKLKGEKAQNSTVAAQHNGPKLPIFELTWARETVRKSDGSEKTGWLAKAGTEVSKPLAYAALTKLKKDALITGYKDECTKLHAAQLALVAQRTKAEDHQYELLRRLAATEIGARHTTKEALAKELADKQKEIEERTKESEKAKEVHSKATTELRTALNFDPAQEPAPKPAGWWGSSSAK